MKKVIGIILLVIVVAVGAVFGTSYFYSTRETTTEAEPVIENIIQEETTITTDTVRSGLREVGELVTEEYYYTGVETYDSSKTIGKFDIPLTTSRFIYSYDGTIKAGVNFEEIEVEKDDLKKLVTVTMPEPYIVSAEIDEKSFQLYDEKTSIFNPVSVSDMNDTLIELEETETEKAIEKGILDRAGENAEKMIKNMIYSLVGADYTVRFEANE